MLNYYEPAQAPGQWGFLDDPAASWKDFIEGGIKEARTNVGSFLPAEDYRLVSSQVALTPAISDPGRAYLLHGDCGVHNLVFHQSRLAGIIDPCPAAGPILYDLVYAFCSSPDDLDTDTLLEAFGLLRHPPVEPVQLFREVLVQLYCRIGTCLLHHPHDLPGYLTAWEYWKKQVE